MLLQGVFVDVLPDLGIAARAGPAPASALAPGACNAAGQAHVAAQGDACLMAKSARQIGKTKKSESGTA